MLLVYITSIYYNMLLIPLINAPPMSVSAQSSMPRSMYTHRNRLISSIKRYIKYVKYSIRYKTYT